MTFSGTFTSVDDKQATLQTQKGPWRLYYPNWMGDQLRALAPGTPVEFSAEQPDGKRYWRLTAVPTPTGGAQAPAGPPSGHPAAPLPEQAQPQYSAPVGASDDKEEGMFVMGVVGRSMGSGQFSVEDIKPLTDAAVRAWRTRGAT